MEQTASADRRSFGVRTAGALILASGVLALGLVTIGSGYTSAENPAEVVAAIGDGSNRGFFQWVVFWAIAWALLAAGVLALAVAIGRAVSSTVISGLAVGAAAMIVVGAALRAADPAILSALVNRWPEDGDPVQVATSSGEFVRVDATASLEVIDQIRFGLEQTGYGVLGVAMFLLCAAIFGSGRAVHPFVGVSPLFIGLYWIAQVSAGDGVSPWIAAMGLPTLGALVLLAAHRRTDL